MNKLIINNICKYNNIIKVSVLLVQVCSIICMKFFWILHTHMVYQFWLFCKLQQDFVQAFILLMTSKVDRINIQIMSCNGIYLLIVNISRRISQSINFCSTLFAVQFESEVELGWFANQRTHFVIQL